MSDERELYDPADPHRELTDAEQKDRLEMARRALDRTPPPAQLADEGDS